MNVEMRLKNLEAKKNTDSAFIVFGNDDGSATCTISKGETKAFDSVNDAIAFIQKRYRDPHIIIWD